MQKSISSLTRAAFIIVAFAFPAYAFFQLASLNTLSTELLKTFPNQPNLISNLSTLYLLMDAIFLIPAGLLLDYLSLKKILPIALMIIIIGVFITAEAHSILFLYTARILMGVGHAFAFLTGFKIIRQCISLKHRAIGMSLVVTFAMIGGFLAQTPLGYIAKQFGWHIALLLDGIFGLCILIAGLITLQFFPDHINKKKSTGVLLKLLKSVKHPTNVLLGLIMGLLSSPLIIIGSTWGSLYLNHVSKLPIHQAEFTSSVIFIATILGMPFFGWLSDLLQRKFKLILASSIVSLIVSIILILTKSHSIYTYFSIFFMLAFLCSSQSLCYVLISETNSKENQNTAMAFSNVLLMLVSALLPILFSFLSWFDSSNRLNFTSSLSYGMLIIPITMLCSIIILFMLQKRVPISKE